MLKRNPAGFTLVELLVASVIIGILASFALPSFTEFIARSNLRSSAESIQGALQLARAEAVRRNEQIIFTLDPDDAGTSSWRITDSDGATIQASRASGEGGSGVTVTKTPDDATTVSFSGFGRAAAGGLTSLDFQSINTAAAVRVQVVSPGGQIRICDPAISASDDPRRCLP